MIPKHKAIFAVLLLFFTQLLQAEQKIDTQTGLIIDKGFESVKKQCTVCHSAKLIVQNKATRQGWKDTIRWMQETQGLQKLNQSTEQEILSYLAKNYAPNVQGRRSPLVVDQWHKLKID